jgi:hypothetical protein
MVMIVWTLFMNLTLYETSKRGHGGENLYFNVSLTDGVQIMDIDNKGVICIKLPKPLPLSGR